MSKKLPFTVIAVIDGVGQIKSFEVEAEDGLNAFAVVASTNAETPLDFVIALNGHQKSDVDFTFPGESLVCIETVLEQKDVFGFVEHGREQHLAGLVGSVSEVNEADRRAGCAERKAANIQDTLDRMTASRRKMKQDAGYDDNVSFDVVWSEVLAKSKQAQTSV